MHSKLKHYALNVSLLLCTLLFIFGGGEVFLRVTGLMSTSDKPSRLYQKLYLKNSEYSEVGYDIKPNWSGTAHFSTITTNEYGFRSPTPDPLKPSIAVLGDSITFGYGVNDDESIPAVLQSLLPEYNVINAAVPGYHLGQQTGMYRHKVSPFNPELTILVFFFNDLVHLETAWVDEDGYLRAPGWTPAQKRQCSPIETGLLSYLPGKCWLDLNSAFYLAVKKLINLRISIQGSKEETEIAAQGTIEDPVGPDELSAYAAQLDAFVALLPSDAPRIFVIWPDRYLHPFALPQLRSIAEQRGFIVVDLYDIFGNTVEILSWDYTHPASAPLKKGAEQIYNVIVEEELLTH